MAQRGPYLLSGNWWDGESWARAEWDVQLEDGELVRCHQSEQPAKLWRDKANLEGGWDL